MIALSCSSCGQRLAIKVEMAGKKGKCPKCGKPVQVPSLDRSEGADWPPSPDALAVPPPPAIHVTGAPQGDTRGPQPAGDVSPEDYLSCAPPEDRASLAGWDRIAF